MFAKGHAKPALCLMLLLCVLSIFLFSAPVGPYSAVHGPATAMRALLASFALFWSIVAATLDPVFVLSPSSTRLGPRLGFDESSFAWTSPSSVLRC